MPKRKAVTAEAHQEEFRPMPDGPVTTATAPTNDVEQAFAEAGIRTGTDMEHEHANGNGNGHAAKVERRQYTPAPDPFDIETINTPDNTVILANNRRQKTYVIRFTENPNEGRAKDDPHPVLQLLKDNGYRYTMVTGKGMAWQKPYQNGDYSVREEMDARDLTRQAAETLGGPAADRAMSR